MSLAAHFPGLVRDGFTQTSPRDVTYNCIAYAVEDTTRWWWPSLSPGANASYWPRDAPNEETVEAFTAAFATEGYEPCEGVPEPTCDAIALFAMNGRVTHAARRKDETTWLSKLGKHVDIEHAIHSVEGLAYGQVVQYYRRTSS